MNSLMLREIEHTWKLPKHDLRQISRPKAAPNPECLYPEAPAHKSAPSAGTSSTDWFPRKSSYAVPGVRLVAPPTTSAEEQSPRKSVIGSVLEDFKLLTYLPAGSSSQASKWEAALENYIHASFQNDADIEDTAFDLVSEVEPADIPSFYRAFVRAEMTYQKECELIAAARSAELYPTADEVVRLLREVDAKGDRICLMKLAGIWADAGPTHWQIVKSFADALAPSHPARAMVLARLEPL